MNFEFRIPNARTTSSEHPYQSSISSSASSSASSVSSVDATSSQSSVASSYSSASSIHISWDTEDPWRTSGCRDVQPPATAKRVLPPVWPTETPVPVEQRQNPRRCSSTSSQRLPPPLVRQSERKGQFVDSLVDSATQMVEEIWPLSVPKCPSDRSTGRSVLPLRTFIQETLRRSRTSYSTLQVALYYLILIKEHVPKYDFTMEQLEDVPWTRALQCGRRMFLAALILASKYLQDRNYSARAWSKISGLKVDEINSNEMAFLKAVNWRLHIQETIFDRWQQIVIRYAPHSQEPPPSPSAPTARWVNEWKAIIPRLTPELNTVEITSRPRPSQLRSPERTATWPPALSRTEVLPKILSPLSTSPPRWLEPKPDMLPPTPSVPRMAPLPTPQMTPQSNASNTPAASLMALGSRRPSMCSAMAQAQNATLQRTAFDQWCSAPRLPGWQIPASALSGSLASSPESMISDSSSRSSRASSISSASSVSSIAMAPTPVKLCRLATLRCARQPLSMQLKEAPECNPALACYYCGEAGHVARNCPISTVKVINEEPLSACEPQSSPDFGSFTISDEESPSPTRIPLPVRPKPTDKDAKGRKRGRSSVDLSLQQNVRDLLVPGRIESFVPRGDKVVADTVMADSFALQDSGTATPVPIVSAKALQSPARSVSERRLPVVKDVGRKRACCAQEALQALGTRSPFQGPGMWEGIL